MEIVDAIFGGEDGTLTFLQMAARAVLVFVLALVLVRMTDRRFLGRHTAFDALLTIVLGGVLLVIGNAITLGSFYGTNTYPLTYKVLDLVGGLFSLFVLIVTAIYAGELVWRERDTRIEDIADSMPAPTWLGFLAKFAALAGLQVALMLETSATGQRLIQQVFELTYLKAPTVGASH